MTGRRSRRVAATALLALGALVRPAVAHAGALGNARNGGAVPTWLTVATGGAVVGASFVFSTLLTDHDAIRWINRRHARLPSPGRVAASAVGWTSAAALVGLGVVALVGPPDPTRNAAILVVWVGWWAGYPMTVYGLGNTWPAINPWRRIAGALPRVREASYPERAGAWPAVAGLLGLVWLEVVTPVASDPGLLLVVVAGYTLVTLAGASVYGADSWFANVDPVARVFRVYGRLAPVQRTGDGLSVRLPTTALAEAEYDPTPGGDAFVVALVWVTTYDGLVTTPAWERVAGPVVGVGGPPLAVHALAVVAGFGLFYGAYHLAARRARTSAGSYVSAPYLRRYFAPALVPIAAGYHLAHFLTYFLTLSPALAAAVVDPLDPGRARLLVLPGWLNVAKLGFVLLGHLLAVWVAHARSIELFPGTLAPIRSQYPVTLVMILYTMTSTWIVTRPFAPLPYV